MSQSWNHKLFFQINAQIGRRKWLDRLVYVCAHWLIYALGFLVLSWSEMMLPADEFKIFIKLLLTTIVFAMAFSWLIAMLWKHPRPAREFPETKLLFQPIESWKAFPSDHTVIAFIFVFLSYLNGASLLLTIVFSLMAFLVGFGRIYAGVHYPRDVIGGFVWALIFCLLSYWLVANITQPMYNFLLNFYL